MHAVGRIAYRGAIDNIQLSWVKLGVAGARQLLRAGVNDLGGTLIDENISRATGAGHGQMMDAAAFRGLVTRWVGPSPSAPRSTVGSPIPTTGARCSPARVDMTGSSFEEGELEAAVDGSGAGVLPEPDSGIDALIASARTPTERRLYRSMVDTVASLARSGTDIIDLKVADTALSEMAEAFRVFQPLRRRMKVTIFGSARTEPDHPAYRQARALAAAMSGAGWMVVTGAGPGIMAAGMEGAGRDQSVGVNIRLPHEQGANRFIAQDPKLVEMRYFFTRKLMLLKESDGFIVLPGGFGTLDEGYELLTLLQTGKAEPAPVVLLDVPGGTFWDGWSRFLADEVEPRGLVSSDDRAFFTITDDVSAAAGELLGFYRNYRSCRWVGDLLVLRMAIHPDRTELSELNRRFADIVTSGVIRKVDPLPPERADGDVLDLARLAFRFDKIHYGRLRQLIDALNALVHG